MVLLDEIADWLTAQGIVGGSTGWAITKAMMPPEPDQVVTIYETPGEAPDVPKDLSAQNQAFDYPGIQVRIRGLKFDYVTTRAKLQQVFLALHQHEPAVTSGENYIYIYATSSGPLPLGKDAQDRDMLSWNFRTMRQRN